MIVLEIGYGPGKDGNSMRRWIHTSTDFASTSMTVVIHSLYRVKWRAAWVTHELEVGKAETTTYIQVVEYNCWRVYQRQCSVREKEVPRTDNRIII